MDIHVIDETVEVPEITASEPEPTAAETPPFDYERATRQIVQTGFLVWAGITKDPSKVATDAELNALCPSLAEEVQRIPWLAAFVAKLARGGPYAMLGTMVLIRTETGRRLLSGQGATDPGDPQPQTGNNP